MIGRFPGVGDNRVVSRAVRAELENAIVRLLDSRSNAKPSDGKLPLSPALSLALRQYDRHVVADERQRRRARELAEAPRVGAIWARAKTLGRFVRRRR